MLALLLIAILAADLLFAAQALPHTHPTAPQAVYDVRTAPAHLLTDPVRRSLGPAAMGRFLAMSIVTFDPGDMSDYRRLLLESQPPQLDEKTFADLVIAQKVQEILAPNLALFWRLPGVDGYDGGVLPLARYNRFWEQFVPPGEARGGRPPPGADSFHAAGRAAAAAERGVRDHRQAARPLVRRTSTTTGRSACD